MLIDPALVNTEQRCYFRRRENEVARPIACAVVLKPWLMLEFHVPQSAESVQSKGVTLFFFLPS
jgi:hypothetical protein